MKKIIGKAKKEQKGISIIALMLVILVIIILASVIMGVVTRDNETSENKISNANETIESPNESNEIEIIEVPAGHEHNYNKLIRVTEPTCKEPGKSYLECDCGLETFKIDKESLGHMWKSAGVTKQPTCQEEGEITYNCENCEEKRKEKIEKILHDFSNQTIKEDYLASEATCTQPATYYFKCQTCDEYGETTFTHEEALGHKWNDGEIIKEATDKKEGKIEYTCTVCEEVREETIPALQQE